MAVNPCCKYLMFFFNLLIFIGGSALVGTAVWILYNTTSFKELVSDDLSLINSVYFLLAAGAFLIVVGFFGCCGAIKENKCMLGLFFVMVFIIFVVEIAGAVLAFVKLPETEKLILESMKKYNDGDSEGEAIKTAWDLIQTNFECCGYEQPADWALALILPLPSSCVGLVQPGCKSIFEQYFLILGGIALGVLFIEILAMVFSCCLFRMAGKDNSGY